MTTLNTGAGTGYGATAVGGAPAAAPGTTAGVGVEPVGTTRATRAGGAPASNICLYILAILVPPLAVFFRVGFRADFWINILLTILAWFPGVIHAWWVIATSRTAVTY